MEVSVIKKNLKVAQLHRTSPMPHKEKKHQVITEQHFQAVIISKASARLISAQHSTHIPPDKKRLTDPVFFSMGWVGNKMSDLGAEIFPNGSAHVVNQIHQALLKVQEKRQVQFSAAHSLHKKMQLQYTRRFKGMLVQTWLERHHPVKGRNDPSCRVIFPLVDYSAPKPVPTGTNGEFGLNHPSNSTQRTNSFLHQLHTVCPRSCSSRTE